jgi:hypothetical protein
MRQLIYLLAFVDIAIGANINVRKYQKRELFAIIENKTNRINCSMGE